MTRDENNQNQDIIEWEEYDVEDLRSGDYEPHSYEEQRVQLTPKGEELVSQLGQKAGDLLFEVARVTCHKYIFPWWKNTAWPWIKEKGRGIRDTVSGSKEQKTTKTIRTETAPKSMYDRRFSEVSSQIDKALEQYYLEMDEDEAKAHMMELIYYMLGIANGIRIKSNAQIRKDCESEELCIERQYEVEKFLSERVAVALDRLLSNERLQLDSNTLRELCSLTGGGIYRNGEYISVQATKIDEALKKIPMSDS